MEVPSPGIESQAHVQPMPAGSFNPLCQPGIDLHPGAAETLLIPLGHRGNSTIGSSPVPGFPNPDGVSISSCPTIDCATVAKHLLGTSVFLMLYQCYGYKAMSDVA